MEGQIGQGLGLSKVNWGLGWDVGGRACMD